MAVMVHGAHGVLAQTTKAIRTVYERDLDHVTTRPKRMEEPLAPVARPNKQSVGCVRHKN